MRHFLKKVYSKWPVLVFDACSIVAAWYLAYWLRFNMKLLPEALISPHALVSLAILWVIQMSCYYHFKVYRGLWRFSSLNDIMRIIKAVLSATLLVIPVLYLASLLPHIPRSVLPLYAMHLIILLCGGRMLFRQYWDQHARLDEEEDIRRVLIVGAGIAGEGLIRDLKRTRSYLPIGLVDDNISKRGLEVHGVRVLGMIRELSDLVKRYEVDLIFIAIPSASSAAMRRIVSACERCHIPFRTLPSLQALASGRVEVNALRPVNIEDLLGRDQVQLTWDKIAAGIQGKRILITGGGGSIGSELARQIIRLKPEKLLILDNSEFNLYNIELELKAHFPDATLAFALVSVTDAEAVRFAWNQFKPELVFHAASFKQVPMLEHQIRIAVQNNVIGTQVVAQASIDHGVSTFIFISTDKAVNPTSIMGTTKRAAEIYCQNLNERVQTQFITVRFGNVLGSVGSVVPLFQKQLQHGGPLTVTHPDMERYFMTISEACQLILQAMVNGEGGEIFVLDMGEPVKIRYLAEQMIRLAGLKPEEDIKIKYIGLRPGEKLFEELFHASEQLEPTAHEKLFKAKFRSIDWHELIEAMNLLHTYCTSYRQDELLVLLKNLVPEFRSDVLSDAALEHQLVSFSCDGTA